MSKIETKKQEVIEELNFRSDTATATARRLSLGVIGVAWGLLVVHSADSLIVANWQQLVVIGAGFTAAASLFVDWLQAIAGYATANRSWAHLKSPAFDPNEHGNFVRDWRYSAATVAFWTKQGLASLGFIALMVAVVSIVIQGLATRS
jgi:hypothetical protein